MIITNTLKFDLEYLNHPADDSWNRSQIIGMLTCSSLGSGYWGYSDSHSGNNGHEWNLALKEYFKNVYNSIRWHKLLLCLKAVLNNDHTNKISGPVWRLVQVYKVDTCVLRLTILLHTYIVWSVIVLLVKSDGCVYTLFYTLIDDSERPWTQAFLLPSFFFLWWRTLNMNKNNWALKEYFIDLWCTCSRL